MPNLVFEKVFRGNLVCDNQDFYNQKPVPAKRFLPDWIKNIDNKNKTSIKKCPPVIDYLISGYCILSPATYHFKREVINGEEEISVDGDIFMTLDMSEVEGAPAWTEIQTISKHEFHQAPLEINGIRKSIFKIYTYWLIKPPEGYSLAYVPLNLHFLPFEILPAIVDADDKWLAPPSFPAMCSFNDNGTYEWTINAGDPIAKVIPIKREEWSSSTENNLDKEYYEGHEHGEYKDWHVKKKYD